jgi:hypothetical protein
MAAHPQHPWWGSRYMTLDPWRFGLGLWCICDGAQLYGLVG